MKNPWKVNVGKFTFSNAWKPTTLLQTNFQKAFAFWLSFKLSPTIFETRKNRLILQNLLSMAACKTGKKTDEKYSFIKKEITNIKAKRQCF